MRAVAQQQENLRHDVKVRSHTITADEPKDHGGDDAGPSPQELLAASLASCTAITMEMYAKRKGWDVAGLTVDCEYTPRRARLVTRFALVMKMPAHLTEEQVEKLAGDRGQVPRPPHARGRGRVRGARGAGLTRARRGRRPRCAASCSTPPRPSGSPSRAPSTPRCWCRSTSTPQGALHAVFTERRADMRRHAGEISFPGGRRDERRRRPVRDRAARDARGDRPAARRGRARSARCSRRRRSSRTTRSIRSSG